MIQPFECKKCENQWEELIRKAYGEERTLEEIREDAECPECGSKDKNKIVGSLAFTFSNPVGTDRYNNSHDYRYRHKTKTAEADRAHALSKEKDGEDPYKYDPTNNDKDVQGGKYFGKVK